MTSQINAYKHSPKATKRKQTKNAKKADSTPKATTSQDTVSINENSGSTFKLQILHTTDMHGSALPVSRKLDSGERVQRGGLDRVAQLAQELRKDYPHTLFVDSGDTVSGQVTTDVDGGRSMVDIMNHMNYDAVTIGNHEFDFGPETLRERIATSAFPTIVTNVRESDGSYIANTVTSKVVDFGEAKVGIVGLLTDDMPKIASDRNISEFQFEDPIAALKRELPKLKEKDVDAVVVLTHQGDGDDRELAEAFPGEGLIIPGGHSHVEFPQVENINGNFLFKSGTQGAAMGRLVADINTETNKPENLSFEMIAVDTEHMNQDSEITELVSKYKAESDKTMNVKVGHLDQALLLDARRDSNLGNLITDAMRAYHETDVAFMNTDGIRRDLPQGDITQGDLHEVFPFQGSEALKGEMQGSQILETLKLSVRHADTDGKSPFLQVSGVEFNYDEEGVHDVKIGGKKLDPNKTYSVANYSYLTGGKLGYTPFLEGKWVNGGIPLTTMLKDYVTGLDQSTLDPTGTRIKDNREGFREA